ncbi:MAG: hypothetical protein ACYSUN_03280 [Planctomycetota bacterium]|jgi:hypothetical protein
MTEGELLAKIAFVEAKQGVSPGLGDGATCETGDEYVELVGRGGGEMWNDESTTMRDSTPEEARARWFELFENYRMYRTGTIHWRIRPEMTEIEDLEEYPLDLYPPEARGFCVYARLFIEEAP